MQIVINIDEELYKTIKSLPNFMCGALQNAVKEGAPLPKGHGRLIDADALWKKWVFDAIGKQEIDEAPTIIEADKTESEVQE